MQCQIGKQHSLKLVDIVDLGRRNTLIVLVVVDHALNSFDAKDFGGESGEFIYFYWLMLHSLCLVHVLTGIVLVTGMGFAPRRGMVYGFFARLPRIPCW